MHKLKQQLHEHLHPSGNPDSGHPTLRILPLGDSITFGIESPDGNGYRQHLQNQLRRHRKINAVFTGSERNGTMPNNHMAGWSAKTIHEVGELMGTSLEQGADVVLLHLGTNDCNPDPGISRQGTDAHQAAMRLGSVLDTVLQRCPQATIFVALIVGTVNDHEREPQQALVDAFNQFVPGVVNERAKAGKRVKLVDMRAVSGHKYISPIVGGVHPNARGYEKMAETWVEALADVQPG